MEGTPTTEVQANQLCHSEKFNIYIHDCTSMRDNLPLWLWSSVT